MDCTQETVFTDADIEEQEYEEETQENMCETREITKMSEMDFPPDIEDEETKIICDEDQVFIKEEPEPDEMNSEILPSDIMEEELAINNEALDIVKEESEIKSEPWETVKEEPGIDIEVQHDAF